MTSKRGHRARVLQLHHVAKRWRLRLMLDQAKRDAIAQRAHFHNIR